MHARHVVTGLVVALLASGSVRAARIVVNTATDDFGSVAGNCSLREAVQSANLGADFGGCDSTGIYATAASP